MTGVSMGDRRRPDAKLLPSGLLPFVNTIESLKASADAARDGSIVGIVPALYELTQQTIEDGYEHIERLMPHDITDADREELREYFETTITEQMRLAIAKQAQWIESVGTALIREARRVVCELQAGAKMSDAAFQQRYSEATKALMAERALRRSDDSGTNPRVEKARPARRSKLTQRS